MTEGSTADYFSFREVWELACTERGFAAITWSPHTFHLTLWTVPESTKPLVYSSGIPSRIVGRWRERGLPPLSRDCLEKLMALETARA